MSLLLNGLMSYTMYHKISAINCDNPNGGTNRYFRHVLRGILIMRRIGIISRTKGMKIKIKATEGPNKRYHVDVSKEYFTPDKQGRILFFPFDGKLQIQIAGISFNIEYLQNPPDKSNDMCQKFNTSLRWNFNSKIFGGPLELTYVKTTTDIPKDHNMPNYCLRRSSFVTEYADIKGNGERCLYGVINVFKMNVEALGFLWSSKLGFKTPTTE